MMVRRATTESLDCDVMKKKSAKTDKSFENK